MIAPLVKACTRLGYSWMPSEKHKPYDLFVFGVRHPNRIADRFDDLIGCAFVDSENVSRVEVWKGTTDPGLASLTDPMNKLGCAVLAAGQHRHSHTPGLHKGKTPALVQASPLPVYRDGDRDSVIEMIGLPITGTYGINIHRAYRDGLTKVGQASAGCQVFHESKDMDRLLVLVGEQRKRGLGASITYTLFDGGSDPDLLSLVAS